MRFSISKSRVLGLTVTAMVAAAHAADPEFDPHEGRFALMMESPPPAPVVFWQRFDSAFDNRADDIFADALQPLNSIRWNLQLRGPDFSDNFRARASGRARSAFLKSVEYGAREASVELPFMVWLDDHQSWFANVLRDSVANVQEEPVEPRDRLYENIEQSWWRNLARSGTHYGVRPFRTSPYAYVSHGFTDGNRTILQSNVRYYYDRFANHRVELALSMPVAYGMALDFGTAYQFGSHDERKLVVKLLKELKGGGVAHVGFEVREHTALIAGISFGW